MDGVKCFWLEEAGQLQRYLRRYHSDCPAPWRFLNGLTPLDVIAWQPGTYIDMSDDWPHDDERWPKICDCGRVFEEGDPWQLFTQDIYRRPDTGETMILRDAPPGAMWNAWWLAKYDRWRGPDGMCLIVKCPPDAWEWTIDGPASNCDKKQDLVHKCWVRHGKPPVLTVDKNGNTCGAGAGSIKTPKWHGYLRDGYLVNA